MDEPLFIDLFIDPNPNTPEGCGRRWKAEGPPRAVSLVRYYFAPDAAITCEVMGVWSAGGKGMPCPAMVVPVEDSGAGESMLIYGGDWGLQITPLDPGHDPFSEPYLLVAAADLLDG